MKTPEKKYFVWMIQERANDYKKGFGANVIVDTTKSQPNQVWQELIYQTERNGCESITHYLAKYGIEQLVSLGVVEEDSVPLDDDRWFIGQKLYTEFPE